MHTSTFLGVFFFSSSLSEELLSSDEEYDLDLAECGDLWWVFGRSICDRGTLGARTGLALMGSSRLSRSYCILLPGKRSRETFSCLSVSSLRGGGGGGRSSESKSLWSESLLSVSCRLSLMSRSLSEGRLWGLPPITSLWPIIKINLLLYISWRYLLIFFL